MNIKSSAWKKISEEEIQMILESISLSGSSLPKPSIISKVLKITNENLINTEFDYFTHDQAIEKFGSESESYIKPNGLPYIIDPIRSKFDYMKGVLHIQLKMHEDFLNGSLPSNISNLSQYVFYSSIAHILSKFGWEPIHF